MRKNILKHVEYLYEIVEQKHNLSEAAELLLSLNNNRMLNIGQLKNNREVKKLKIKVLETLSQLKEDNIIRCTEVRYDFKNTKISTS